jgi:hypothetical protein
MCLVLTELFRDSPIFGELTHADVLISREGMAPGEIPEHGGLLRSGESSSQRKKGEGREQFQSCIASPASVLWQRISAGSSL